MNELQAKEAALQEQANRILREAGDDDLCRVELLQTPTEFFKTAPDDDGTSVVGYHAPYGATYRKAPAPLIYQPVAQKAVAAKRKGLPCPNCGKPKSIQSPNPQSVCVACYRARAVEKHKKRIETVAARQEAFRERFSSWEIPAASPQMRATEDHSIALIEAISKIESRYQCPIVRWAENWIGVEPVDPLTPIEVEALTRAWNNARIVFFGWRSGITERRVDLGKANRYHAAAEPA